KPVHEFVPIHFMHNLITSTLILPTGIELHDVWHTVKEATPYWDNYWDGTFPPNARLYLTLNLFLLAMGIAVGWRFSRMAGLVPLGVFIFYNLANSFARTSGGRYVVPIDWVVIFYFALGAFQLILWGMSVFGVKTGGGSTAPVHPAVQLPDEPISELWTWPPLKKAAFIIILFLTLGALIPLSEQPFERRYPDRTQAELLAFLDKEGYLQQMGFEGAEIRSAVEKWPEFRIVAGRALYPRYFLAGKGIPKNRFPYNAMDCPRVTLTLIGPQGGYYVLLPLGNVPHLPNMSDVYIVGCRDGETLDALALVVIDQPSFVYVREPASPIQCPLQQPVCDEDRVCR
ncbi:MAG: hypothetical protein HYZ23_05100, partial [Chloroflexi bacterium]|nr:hypothetical protein [Chloroflexota bacterium]